jgi:hypothetical protein
MRMVQRSRTLSLRWRSAVPGPKTHEGQHALPSCMLQPPRQSDGTGSNDGPTSGVSVLGVNTGAVDAPLQAAPLNSAAARTRRESRAIGVSWFEETHFYKWR